MPPATPATPSIEAAILGKHPAWEDFVQRLDPPRGRASPRLVELNDLLCERGGINANLGKEPREWAGLPAEQRLDGFDHVLVWRIGGELVLARVSATRDLRNRRHYPLLTTLRFASAPLAWAIPAGLDALEGLRGRLVSEPPPSREAVAAALAAAETELRAAAPTSSFVSGAAETELLPALVNHPAWGEGRVGLLRVLYDLEKLKPRGGATGRSGVTALRPQTLRVPAAGDGPAACAARWLALLEACLGPRTPVMLLAPVGKPWLDVIVGELAGRSAAPLDTRSIGALFFGLRATPQGLALVSDAPYELDEAFLARARAFVEDAATGRVGAQAGPGAAALAPAPRGLWAKLMGRAGG